MQNGFHPPSRWCSKKGAFNPALPDRRCRGRSFTVAEGEKWLCSNHVKNYETEE
jgi:hypothetical protein